MRELCTTPASPETLDLVHAALDRFWTALERDRATPLPPATRFGFTTAVAEVAANIILHARAETINLALTQDGTRIEACFHDRGIPYQGGGGAELDPFSLPEGGMGLTLARRVVDSLEYERSSDGVNCWRLVLALPAV